MTQDGDRLPHAQRGVPRSQDDSDTGSEAIAEDGDEGELWGRQAALIEEDEKEGLNLTGFDPEEVPEILEAMGDDAAEPLVDSPNGTSATGLWSEPEHGGFPERTE